MTLLAILTAVTRYRQIVSDRGSAPIDIEQGREIRFDLITALSQFPRPDPGITYLLHDPFHLRHKDDPRCAAFCCKVGLRLPGGAAHKK